MKVTILGSGAYGIALALMLNENKCEKKYNKCFFQPKIKIDTQFNDFIFIDQSTRTY